MTAPNVLRVVPGGLLWNPQLRRYIGANGRILSTATVRASIDATLLNYQIDARRLAGQLRDGTLSLQAWDEQMRRLVKDANLLGAASARGGWVQLIGDKASLGRAGREIRKQYAFLDAFVRDIGSGKQSLAGIESRAVMYAQASRGTFEDERLAQERAAGYDEERSIRHASDSCEGCIREAGRGWVPIGTLVHIGDRNCLTRCRCNIERRKSGRTRTPRAPRIRTQQREPAFA